jgi:hypothetical protein
MCGRGPMNDALGALERLFRHSDNARDQWFTKMVTGAEILGGVPQPQTGVPASDTRAVAFHHP